MGLRKKKCKRKQGGAASHCREQQDKAGPGPEWPGVIAVAGQPFAWVIHAVSF